MSTATAPQTPAAAPTPQRAASTGRRILTHASLEARTLLGNGEQLMVAIVLPALVLLGLHLIPLPDSMFDGRALTMGDKVAATAVTAIIATSMTSQSIATGFDRRAGVLRWIATTPLGRSGYIAGKLLALGLIHLLQVAALGALALALGWHPSAAQVLTAVLPWLLGTAAFGALGLLIAGTLRAEGVLALANLAFIALVAGGGVALPVESFPSWAQPLVQLLPSGALMALVRAALNGAALPWLSALILAGWTVLFTVLTVRFFKWTSA
ncbi:ABC transporter permease [Helcobacillus massiliensis]|uniref:ABC-2 type transport system permease protein n=1 Tax=Helcobacillus massiliensis TaxID=521392 RepID=A0A839QRK9_9MICO|nr:ABC transporter permease [Helcobacillus massiliensis]MBB3022308.1 ABC-2 type transport system permease protein [Helcobacillus massiliensis]